MTSYDLLRVHGRRTVTGREVGMAPKPKILNITTAAQSRCFQIEVVELRFSNGVESEYERLSSSYLPGAVIIVPMIDRDNVLLVKEYAVGTDRYEWGLPKGLVRKGEHYSDAAKRELTEEVNYGAATITALKKISIAPGFLTYETWVTIAEDMYPFEAQGDEIEPLEMLVYPLRQIGALFDSGKVTEARSIAALFMAREHLYRSERAGSAAHIASEESLLR